MAAPESAAPLAVTAIRDPLQCPGQRHYQRQPYSGTNAYAGDAGGADRANGGSAGNATSDFVLTQDGVGALTGFSVATGISGGQNNDFFAAIGGTSNAIINLTSNTTGSIQGTAASDYYGGGSGYSMEVELVGGTSGGGGGGRSTATASVTGSLASSVYSTAYSVGGNGGGVINTATGDGSVGGSSSASTGNQRGDRRRCRARTSHGRIGRPGTGKLFWGRSWHRRIARHSHRLIHRRWKRLMPRDDLGGNGGYGNDDATGGDGASRLSASHKSGSTSGSLTLEQDLMRATPAAQRATAGGPRGMQLPILSSPRIASAHSPALTLPQAAPAEKATAPTPAAAAQSSAIVNLTSNTSGQLEGTAASNYYGGGSGYSAGAE